MKCEITVRGGTGQIAIWLSLLLPLAISGAFGLARRYGLRAGHPRWLRRLGHAGHPRNLVGVLAQNLGWSGLSRDTNHNQSAPCGISLWFARKFGEFHALFMNRLLHNVCSWQ